MTKKPESVKEEDLIVGEDGLYYKKNAKVPFTGISEEFWVKGQLKSKENYKDGKEDGLWESYQENGQLWLKVNYKDGKLDGKYIWYFNDGEIYKVENYKDGIKID